MNHSIVLEQEKKEALACQAEMTFYDLVKDIVETKAFCRMHHYRHHLHGSTFEHSIKVAYLCYCHHRRSGKSEGLYELVRAALLHDYFLYDHHAKEGEGRITGLRHGLVHPRRALENAERAYPDLTKGERDAIRRHMFPLTLVPPKTRCGWLVCFYDKVAAIGDYCNRKKWKTATELQQIFGPCPQSAQKL